MAIDAFLAGVCCDPTSVISFGSGYRTVPGGLLLRAVFLSCRDVAGCGNGANYWKGNSSATVLMNYLEMLCHVWVARFTKVKPSHRDTPAVLMSQGGESLPSYSSPPALPQQAINAEVLANMTAIVVLSMIMTPLQRYTVRPLFQRTRAAAAVDDVEEHAGELTAQRADYRIRAHGAGGQPNAASLQCHHFHSGQRSRHHQRRTRIRFQSLLEWSHPRRVVCQRRGTHRHRSGMDNGEKCGQIVENIHHINPNAKVFSARLGQTQCAGPSESGSGFVVRETFYSSWKWAMKSSRHWVLAQELRAVHDKVRDADKNASLWKLPARNLKAQITIGGI